MNIKETIKEHDSKMHKIVNKIGVFEFCGFLFKKMIDNGKHELTFDEINEAKNEYIESLANKKI